MYEYIKGHIEEITPAYAVVESQGIGYLINISLNTYTKINKQKEIMLYLHYIVREDAQLFYGFVEKSERELFRLLISVSGIGANTARMILSSMTSGDLIIAISSNNVDALKAVKGIGAKTAQRVIIELKDKIGKESISEVKLFNENPYKEEAASALVMLGFSKSDVNKVLDKVSANNEVSSVEIMVKLALKQL